MKLTPEQQGQVKQAKARGERRLTLQFTPEQRKAYRDAVEQELADKDVNIAHFRKIKDAAEQPGFFGDIRRAILLSRGSVNELAVAIGIDVKTLSDFRAGDAQLPAEALESLVDTLGLRLMQEIPR